MLIVSLGGSLHLMSKLIFWKSKKNIMSSSSAEFAQRVLKIKTDFSGDNLHEVSNLFFWEK